MGFIEATANWALVSLTVVLVILTLVLVIVTIVYVCHTRRLADDTKIMADIMVREFELRIAPFIVIDQLSHSGGGNSKEYQPVICNKGSLPVHIKRVVLEWWYKESPGKTYQKYGKIEKTLGRDESTKWGDYVIKLNKTDMVKEDFEQSQSLDFIQLRTLAQGKIYCVYTDVNGKEQKTRDLHFLETL